MNENRIDGMNRSAHHKFQYPGPAQEVEVLITLWVSDVNSKLGHNPFHSLLSVPEAHDSIALHSH